MVGAAVMYAKDLDTLVRFYAALGLRVDEAKPGEYAVLTGSQLELSIVQSPQHSASKMDATSPRRVREQTPIKLVFVVPSIDAALKAAGLHGGWTQEASSRWQFRGHSIQDAIDPEGNVYQLREPLPRRAPAHIPRGEFRT